MEFEISLHLRDRDATQAILDDLRAEREELEFTIESAEESDAVGMTTEDVIVSIIISFGSSVAATIAMERTREILSKLRSRHPAVTGGEVNSGVPIGQDENLD